MRSAPQPLLLSDPGRLDRALSPDADDLGRAQEHQEPGGQPGQDRKGGGLRIPDQVIQPGEDDEARDRDDPGGQPVP
jgi:hypothetical protein